MDVTCTEAMAALDGRWLEDGTGIANPVVWLKVLSANLASVDERDTSFPLPHITALIRVACRKVLGRETLSIRMAISTRSR